MRKILAALFLLGTLPVMAQIKTETVNYKLDGVEMEGFLAYNAASKAKLPGIVIVHDWMGLGEQSKDSAKKLAEMGYVAFAADIYGKTVRPKSSDEAGKLAGSYKGNLPLLRARIQAAVDILKAQTRVDGSRLGAIGYCFGGTTVLELARSGSPIQGVVSFHGGLATTMPSTKPGVIKSHVLVLHGADDPFVKKAEVDAFIQEMQTSKIDWQMVSYGNSVHSFTNPAAGTDNSKGAAYNELAAKRSWEAMSEFFKEIF